MRFIFLILNFLLLFLAAAPCSDSRECAPSTENASYAAANNHTEHRHQSEGCSPFCTCSCCSVASFYVLNYKAYAASITPADIAYVEYQQSPLSTVAITVWQPPRIS